MTTAGLTLTRQEPAAAAATVDLDAAPSNVWRALWLHEDLRTELIEAVREAARGRTQTAFLDAMGEAGVDALGGGFATLAVGTARGKESAALVLLRATRLMGSNTLLLESAASPAAMFATTNVTPTIAVRLDLDGFRDLRADQRRDLCQLLAVLAQGCDVRIVGTGLALHELLREHRTDLPASVDESAIASPTTARVASELDAEAITPAAERVLDLVADEPSDTLTYGKLARRLDIERPTVRSHVSQRLVPAGAVTRVDHRGDAAVRLTFAGNAYLDQIGRQRRLGGWSEGCVEDTGHSSDNTVLRTSEHEGEGEKGLVETEEMTDEARHAAAGAAVSGDVVLVDHAVERWEDGRGRRSGYDEARDELIISTEYHRALQWWVSSAFALTEPLTLKYVLGADRVDDVLAEYGIENLRDRLQVGWLSKEVETAEDLLDALEGGREELAELTRKHHRGDYDDLGRLESDITKLAIGLATSMVHLLDAAGCDVVQEVRLPEFGRNYNDERRAAVVKSVVNAVVKQSTYDSHAAYRQLFERREMKRRTAISPRIDAADPEGEVSSTFVLVGDGVGGLEGQLARRIEDPEELHDEAPEFSVPATVATPSRSATAAVATRLLTWKKMRPTRDAVSFLHGLAASPYAVAAALSALSKEDHREVRLDEVRYALSTLPTAELLPDALPSIRAMVSALLDTDRPLSQTELADRAGISTRSVRRHADRLAALDLVRRDDDGWRLALTFHTAEERHQRIVPWYCTPNRDRDDFEDATVAGILWRAVEELDEPPDPGGSIEERPADLAGRGDVDGLRRAWPWLDGLLELVAVLAVHEPEDELARTVTFGADVEQQRLPVDLSPDRPRART